MSIISIILLATAVVLLVLILFGVAISQKAFNIFVLVLIILLVVSNSGVIKV